MYLTHKLLGSAEERIGMKRQSVLRWTAGLSLLLIPFASSAADLTGISYSIHHQYTGPRPLGMGDAFVAVANDYNAILYNPAGLARRDRGEINLFIDAGISASLPKLYKDVNAAQKSGTESEQQQAMFDLLQAQYGKSSGLRVMPLAGFWARPRWGIAVIPADLTMENTFHQGVGPTMNSTVYLDTTVALGYGDDYKGFSTGRLSYGFTGKFINRGYFSKSVNFVELASDSSLVKTSDLREGFGIDGDLGVLYTPNIPADGIFSLLQYARPTFGVVVRNLVETKFKSSAKLLNKQAGQTEAPEQLYRVVDLGTKWEYPSAWIFSGRGVMDFRDLNHPQISFRKSLHLGLEFDWSVASWWRGQYRVGLNQGYFTGGVSAMFAIFNLDAVTYGEEVGTYSTPAENRVYAVRLNLNF